MSRSLPTGSRRPRTAELAFRVPWLDDYATGRARAHWFVAGVTFAVAIAVVWEGIVQYLATGHVHMHWSRPMLASLLVMLAGMLLLTALLLEMMELIVDQRAGGARTLPPDRVRDARPGLVTSPATVFDKYAETYDSDCMRGLALSGESSAYFARGRAAHLARWWARSGRPAPQTIIDYGCGTGEGTLALAAEFSDARVIGLDISAEAIERAVSRGSQERVEFDHVQRGQTSIPRAELLHMNGVLHHVDPADRDRLLKMQSSALASKGVMALFENNPLNPGTRWVMSRIPFDRDAAPLRPSEAIRRIDACGLHVEQTSYLFWFPRFLAVLRRLEPFLETIPFGARYAVFASKD